eukprot:COSAG01_NODE_10538_length_2136_cov_49.687285_1_plen_184_part_00
MPRYEWQPAKLRTVDVKTSLGRRVVPVQSFDTARTIAHNIEARHDDARRREQNVRRAAADELRAERAARLAEEEASEHRAKMQALAYNDDEIKRLLLGVREGMLRSAAERKLFEQRSTRAHARHEAVRPPQPADPLRTIFLGLFNSQAHGGARAHRCTYRHVAGCVRCSGRGGRFWRRRRRSG